jgi:hypothetical protein
VARVKQKPNDIRTWEETVGIVRGLPSTVQIAGADDQATFYAKRVNRLAVRAFAEKWGPFFQLKRATVDLD